jgi:hypothetical protein
MRSEVEKKTYYEINTTLQNRKNDISLKFDNTIDIFQDSIEVSFYLYDNLQSKVNERYETIREKVTGPKSLIPFLFLRNIHYLIAANELVLLGLINPSNLNLRTVFENITMIYLLNVTNEEADIYYKKEKETLTEDEENDFRNKYSWLSQNYIRKILYTKEKNDEVKEYYGAASNSAHPTVKGTMLDIEINYDAVIDSLKTSLALSAANLIAFHESYFEMIEVKEVDEIAFSLERISIELNNQITNIIPNNPKVADKLSIKF